MYSDTLRCAKKATKEIRKKYLSHSGWHLSARYTLLRRPQHMRPRLSILSTGLPENALHPISGEALVQILKNLSCTEYCKDPT
ncbi:hypothetical protein BDV38DRAFT_232045 [Aspergillus pseudotamarii]|uniref:Uncharacterized protein n=1 Tax=Aspergillus pseudotamarii TaxID=132259 RepID=A0A5N6TBU4_ASPPS|nr:uncharacterized protein BDV38DRAFT_232045 [Aspergillus pseudotamarii]KAE8143772.1 hypothetical protein BDV38DRAFT_232045 [Aspergillus pseudotamarii]